MVIKYEECSSHGSVELCSLRHLFSIVMDQPLCPRHAPRAMVLERICRNSYCQLIAADAAFGYSSPQASLCEPSPEAMGCSP